MIDNKIILITGGTGSFGQECTRYLLQNFSPKKLIIFSRDELKQYEMQKKFKNKNLRFFIGDIRDKSRLVSALREVDYVIHAAALKHVPAAEYNPIECVRTNIMGAENLINAAIECKVKKVLGEVHNISPFLKFKAIHDICKALVALLTTEVYLEFTFLDISFSKVLILGP